MNIRWWRWIEVLARYIVWAGAFTFLLSNVWGIIKSTDSLISVIGFCIVACTGDLLTYFYEIEAKRRPRLHSHSVPVQLPSSAEAFALYPFLAHI